jgi:hypothetical protein
MLDVAQVQLVVNTLEEFLAFEATYPESQSLAPQEGSAPFGSS